MYGEADAATGSGNAVPTAFAPRRSSARSRAGTTPATPPRRRVQFVGTSLDATRFASIDPEEFFDFQSTRPQVRSTSRRVREITWPDVEVFEARVPRAPRDLVLIVGHEPSMRWRGFCQR